jgi:hypothetical protein
VDDDIQESEVAVDAGVEVGADVEVELTLLLSTTQWAE